MNKVVNKKTVGGIVFGMALASSITFLGSNVYASEAQDLPTEYTPNTPENEGIMLIDEIGSEPVYEEEKDYLNYLKYLGIIPIVGIGYGIHKKKQKKLK